MSLRAFSHATPAGLHQEVKCPRTFLPSKSNSTSQDVPWPSARSRSAVGQSDDLFFSDEDLAEAQTHLSNMLQEAPDACRALYKALPGPICNLEAPEVE